MIKGAVHRPSQPGRGRQARGFDRFEDIHIVRLAQHGCDSRTRHMNRSTGSPCSLRGLLRVMCQNESYDSR